MAILNGRKSKNVTKKIARPAPQARIGDAATTFPIVAVGASAGGLEAFLELLRNMPGEPNAALIYIAHLDPRGASALPQILARETSMPVVEVKNGMAVERNNLYVMPPNVAMTIERGRLRLNPSGDGRPHMPIDTFLQSLADDQGSRAIGVILSGTASDGALGTRAVKNEGGMTFAQDESARFDGMPRSAVAAGSIDFVLDPREIAKELIRIAQHPYIAETADPAKRLPQSDLSKLFALLKSAHEIDFTQYKPNTVERRIRRRMALNRVDTVEDYLKLLRENPVEVEQLYSDVLIRVTGFFRDPEVFEALKNTIVPKILSSKGEAVRVWVPGCATGEEVYSLAILLHESAVDMGVSDCPIQLFGTDVSDTAIERARAGIYPENIAAEVSPDRLRRFFTKMDGNYRVAKGIRDCCIFARQNVTRDPPFSKLDLISCRNVMIYLGAVLQRKVTAIFHYALRPDGYLLLGSSETVTSFGDLFTVVDRRHKIYRKKPVSGHAHVEFEATAPLAEIAPRALPEHDPGTVVNVFREADRIALARFVPSGVLINDAGDIVQFRGRTSAFLEPAPGAANFNILKMAREGLLGELRTALHTARQKDAPVRREGLHVKSNGRTILANVEVLPFTTIGKERFQLVIFEEVEDVRPEKKGHKSAAKASKAASRELTEARRELAATREYLQSIIEEQEAMIEELRSANEEIQSSNEELQSTNEELETAKEELQSSNEELTTLNEELENTNRDLGMSNDDMTNLLASIDLPVVMLGHGLRIRRFNPGAQKALGIRPSDLGRPLDDLNTSLQITDLRDRVLGVIESLTTHEAAVPDREGRQYVLRIRPYRTLDNKIEGAVMLLIEIDTLKRALVS